jgi:uncharacterized sulfatase
VLDSLDETLGRLFDRIRESETLRGNTLILVCSDNGPEPGAGSAGSFQGKRLRGSKGQLYEGGIRSPLIMWGPGFVSSEKEGTVNRTSVFSTLDVAPTLAALAGANVAGKSLDGEALVDVFLGKSEASRTKPLFFRRPPDRDAGPGGDLPDLAVREGDWKLLCEYDGSDPQLYDLTADPGETKNLAAEQPELVAKLAKEVVAWHESLPADRGATFRPADQPR